MATLKDTHKEFIVKELACFKSPKEIIESLEKHFGLDGVESKQVVYYNPELPSGNKLGEKWKVLHKEIRTKYVEGVSDVPIANKGYRLRILQGNLDSALSASKPNMVLINQILKQAQEEMIEIKVPEGGTGGGDSYYIQMNTLIQQAVSSKK